MSAYSQTDPKYHGGNGDGFSIVPLIQTNSVHFYSKFNGGIADGVAEKTLQQESSVLFYSKFTGGIGDGFAAKQLLQENSVPVYSKFYGGVSDGFASFSALLYLSDDSINIPGKIVSSDSVFITSNTPWTASSDSWLTVNPTQGTGNDTIIFTAEINPTIDVRIATINVTPSGGSAQTVIVLQAPGDTTLAVSLNSVAIGRDEGSLATIEVVSNTSWEASCDQSWLLVSPDTMVAGDATLTFTATKNPTIEIRTANVTITAEGIDAQVVTITQAVGDTVLTPSSSWLTVGMEANSTVSTQLISNTSWNVVVDESWLTVNPATGQGNNTLVFTAEVNETGSSRTAIATLSADLIDDRHITIVQKVFPVITWENPSDIVFGDTLTETQLNATSNVDGVFKYTPDIGTLLNVGSSQLLNVSFTPTDTLNYAGTSKTVLINVIKATPVIVWENPEDIVYGTALSALQLNATCELDGTYTYTPDVSTVLNGGQSQPLNVVFNPLDTANYLSASRTVSINVLKATPVVIWENPEDIVYGTTLSETQLNATSSIDGIFTYTPVAGALLSAGSSQSLSVEFTPTDIVNYEIVSKTVQINVNKAVPIITWNNPEDIVYGTALSEAQLNATADVPGTFSYNTNAGTILNVGVNQELEVIFTPNDILNYSSASAIVLINVIKAIPVISWDNPADIVYGTTLSSVQLNATSNVVGEYIYTPPFGTKLGVGDNQSLRVDFNPTDTANYETTSKTVSINVVSSFLTVSLSTVIVDAAANSSSSVDIAANVTWSAISDQSWLTVSPASGTGNATLTFTVAANVTTTPRSAIATISAAGANAQTVIVTQEAPSLLVSTNTVTIAKEANSTATVDVTSNTSWSVSSSHAWLTVSPSSGNGNATLTFTAEANTLASARGATVSVSATGVNAQTVIVNQEAGSETDVETENKDALTLYPNPVTDGFYINGLEGSAMLCLYDTNGRLLIRKEVTDKEYIPINNLSTGMYFIKVKTASGVMVYKKLIKN
ncbi:hypothetical protein CYCD_01190 [Tenuifilaceae bacterium CYCD]|nr:hypothetical protein CYCD_01190 [Tenuifilaceae bacterium CYCD]